MQKIFTSRYVVLLLMFLASLLTGVFLFQYLGPDINSSSSESLKKEALSMKNICTHDKLYKRTGLEWAKLICYAGEMEKVALKYGQSDSHKVMIELWEADLDSTNCHIIAHGIGWGVYRKAPDKMKEAIAKSSSFCNEGEQHGIVEKHMETIPGGSVNKENVGSICGADPRGECNRMVGHMILVLTENDIDEAIDICSGMDNDEQAFICYGGLMMERFIGYNLMEHEIIPSEDLSKRLFEFKSYCGSLSGDIEVACWQGLAHPASTYFEGDPGKIFDFCNSAPNKRAIDECSLHALSELVAAYKVDINDYKSLCAIGDSTDSDFETKCYAELASLYLKPETINDKQVKRIGSFCSSLGSAYQTECYKSIGISLKEAYLPEEDIKDYCRVFDEKYMNNCYSKQL